MFGFGKSNDSSVDNKKVERSVKLIKESGPAVSLEKVKEKGGIDLLKKTEVAGTALSSKGLYGIRAQAVMVLDFSGSMSNDYANGTVQSLAERFLGFALQVDADGEIPIIPFGSNRLPTINVTMDNYQGVIDRELVRKQSMGSTNLSAALEEVKRLAKTTDAPLFVGVVTDGNPNSRPDATRLVCELAGYPVFLKFIALYDVPYLQDLDDLPDTERLLDNVDAKFYDSLTNVADDKFAEDMVDEWQEWIKLATAAGVLT